MSKTIKIVDYDPHWATLYEEEKRQILEVIGHLIVRIEHIGSTAVPNLGAEPIIDIMVAVRYLRDAEKCIEPLRSIGYECIPKHEASVPGRRYFRKGHPPKEQHYHLHMVEGTSDFWKKDLRFRDHLRAHPKVAQEYYELKKKLAIKYSSDHEAYTTAKTPFVETAIAEAYRERRAIK